MRLPRATREYAHLTVTADVDLTAATLLVSIDDGVYTEWEWTGPPTSTGDLWTRFARMLLAGPDADPGTATVLAVGRHSVSYRVTGIEPERPTRTADPVDVV